MSFDFNKVAMSHRVAWKQTLSAIEKEELLDIRVIYCLAWMRSLLSCHGKQGSPYKDFCWIGVDEKNVGMDSMGKRASLWAVQFHDCILNNKLSCLRSQELNSSDSSCRGNGQTAWSAGGPQHVRQQLCRLHHSLPRCWLSLCDPPVLGLFAQDSGICSFLCLFISEYEISCLLI